MSKGGKIPGIHRQHEDKKASVVEASKRCPALVINERKQWLKSVVSGRKWSTRERCPVGGRGHWFSVGGEEHFEEGKEGTGVW